MKKLLLLLFMFCPQLLWASYFQGCGTYLIRGKLKTSVKGFELIVFEGSQSETRLKIQTKDKERYASLSGSEVEMSGHIRQAINNYRGKVTPKSLQLSTPNPLAANKGQGFWIHKRKSCE